MKKIIKTSHIINAPIENVWVNISKATGVNTWLPVITSCHLEGQGEGAKRVCRTEQGDMNETIVKIDHENKIFQYSIDKQPLLPIDNPIGTMELKIQNGSTQLNWNLEFDIKDESLLSEVQRVIEGMYKVGAKGLESISQ